MTALLLAAALASSPPFVVVPELQLSGSRFIIPPPSAVDGDGLVGADIDLDSGNFSLILDDGASGAGNGSFYFGQDTDLQCHRSAANEMTCEGNLRLASKLLAGATANTTDWPRAQGMFSAGDTSDTWTGYLGVHGEAAADATYDAYGLYGAAKTSAANAAYGIYTATYASGAGDTTTAYGGGFNAISARAGTNIGISVAASNGGTNIALQLYGDIETTIATDWDLLDNDASSLSFDAAGKAGILEIDTTDTAEGVKMSGYLDVTGTTTTVGLTASGFTSLGGGGSNTGTFYSTTGLRVGDTGAFYFNSRSKWTSSANGINERTNNAGSQGLREDLTVDGVVTYTDESGNPLIFTFTAPPVFADYTRHHDTPIGAAIVGAAAPGEETIGTYRCKVFDANADLAYISVEVPSEWNGTSDMAIDLLVFTDQGDALGNGEVIEFDLVYRSVDEGEAYDNGTAVTILANVTGGASEVDKGQYNITATVDHDDTDQPLAVNDTLGFSIMRDVTTGDTYSGDVHVCRAQLVYTAHALASH